MATQQENLTAFAQGVGNDVQAIQASLATKASLLDGKLPLSQLTPGSIYTISLTTAKATESRNLISTRTDISIRVVGGSAQTDWPEAATWLNEAAFDYWEYAS